MSDWRQKLGTGLQGFGAGLAGFGPQWVAMQNAQRDREKQMAMYRQEQAGAARGDRSVNAALAIRAVGEQLDAGNVDRAVTILNESMLGSMGTPVQNVASPLKQLIAGGRIDDAKNAIKLLDQEFTTRLGLPPAPQPERPKPLSNSEVINGQVVTPTESGGYAATPVQGFQAPPNNGVSQQFGDSVRIRDSAGNLFNMTTVRDPSTGQVRTSYAPIGGAPERPQGQVEIVGAGGMTPSERVEQSGLEAGEQAAARTAIERSDEYITQLNSLDSNMELLEQAREALNSGANTGPIISRFPALRAQSAKLNAIQRSLGLNVIQSTTFGSLSQDELRVALMEGLPTDLPEDMLLQHIETKINAQNKLRDYLRDAAIFLGVPGNTQADWLKYQQNRQIMGATRERPDESPPPAELPAPGRSEHTEGQTATNPQTGEQVVFRNGQWVPIGGR